MCASLALCQPANTDLNFAAGDVFLFIHTYIQYIYSLQDKLLISPKIVCCNMIPNLGGPRGGKLVDTALNTDLSSLLLMRESRQKYTSLFTRKRGTATVHMM